MIQMNIAEGCQPTGRVLRDLLRERGVEESTIGGRGTPNAVICWGNGYTGPMASLNRHASRYNKLEQLQKLRATPGIRTVPLLAPLNGLSPESFPAFARKTSHSGGTDIRLCLEPSHANLYAQNGWSFATKYISPATEYRVWVYRRRHLGTYEKHLARPAEFLASRRFGANFDNGYSFRLVAQEHLPQAALDMAMLAVDGLGLDFGAVDILKGRDNQFYILEVNTAPGVEGPDRQVIQALADKISWWVAHNYPLRNGDENAYVRPGGHTAAARTQPAATPNPVALTPNLPSFLPRPGESFGDWTARIYPGA